MGFKFNIGFLVCPTTVFWSWWRLNVIDRKLKVLIVTGSCVECSDTPASEFEGFRVRHSDIWDVVWRSGLRV